MSRERVIRGTDAGLLRLRDELFPALKDRTEVLIGVTELDGDLLNVHGFLIVGGPFHDHNIDHDSFLQFSVIIHIQVTGEDGEIDRQQGDGLVQEARKQLLEQRSFATGGDQQLAATHDASSFRRKR
jgi:hypothetical protein